MKNVSKYGVQYFAPENPPMRWAKRDHVEKAPVWCSVDLRDGNQALVVPMSLDEKIEFFETLVKVGFKEIEVGFPSASETDYDFIRMLIERELIPDDVTIVVLTQAREHLIRKTYECLKGAKRAVVHFYNSVSVLQREVVFRKDKAGIKKLATDAATLCKELEGEAKGIDLYYEYSPESFTGTEPEYALEEVRLSVERLEGYILQCQAQRNDTPAARCGRMAVEYIGAHYADCDLKLPDLLEHLGVSRSYFSTVFKEKTGQSFVEYLTNLRMEKAKEYLRETGLCTYEIADRIGFADPHYFSLTFRRRTGMTPKQYREAEK